LRQKIHWHPLLLGLYPSLHLMAQNTDSVRPQAAMLSLVYSAVASLLVWLVCSVVLKNYAKGTLLTALVVVLFFSHGHMLSLVGGGAGAAWVLIAVGMACMAAASIFLIRWKGNTQPINRALDLVGLALILIVVVPITQSELKRETNIAPGEQQTDFQTPLGYLPDIYVIILDGFGRADKLQEIYDVDLTELQTHLEENNFEIAKWANANYCQTSLSLASLLNSDYVTNLLPRSERTFRGRKNLNRIVHVNRNVSRLRGMGYQLVTLAGGSELTVQTDPDVNYKGGALNEFQATFLSTTPLPVLSGLFNNKKASALDPFAQHREGVLFQMRKLPYVTAGPGPKLVFAHVLAPHPPFVIGPEGEEITPNYEFSVGERYAWDGYVQGYAGQATWMAKELQKTVDGILASSQRPPVILIAGDHGPASQWIDLYHRTNSFETTDPSLISERMAIFFALHMPPGKGGDIYSGITLVNVFPLIFERCFGIPAQLRTDHGYFSTYDQWSKFLVVDDIIDDRP
jgi:hypothetical protein